MSVPAAAAGRWFPRWDTVSGPGGLGNYNPVFYVAGITDESQANGLYIGLDLDDDPMMIQYTVFRSRVPPGQAGHDPAQQPILLHQGVEEVSDVALTIRVQLATGSAPPPGCWTVMIEPSPQGQLCGRVAWSNEVQPWPSDRYTIITL